MFFLDSAASIPRALCLALWEAKPEGIDVPQVSSERRTHVFFSAPRQGSLMGHCTPGNLSLHSPALVVPLSKPGFNASVFTLQPVARAVCSQWAVTLPPRMLLCIC